MGLSFNFRLRKTFLKVLLATALAWALLLFFSQLSLKSDLQQTPKAEPLLQLMRKLLTDGKSSEQSPTEIDEPRAVTESSDSDSSEHGGRQPSTQAQTEHGLSSDQQSNGTNSDAMNIAAQPPMTTTSYGMFIDRVDNFNWTINEENLCTERHPNITTLLVVHTAIGHFERRNLYRQIVNSHFTEQDGFVLLFVLGISENPEDNQKIRFESSMHHDIIQQDFLDTYRNLTWKALAWMRFVDEHCRNTEYVLKIDDDTLFDPFAMQASLDNIRNASLSNSNTDGHHIICSVFAGEHLEPIRVNTSKWYLTRDEYAPDYFHPYCQGMLYALTKGTTSALLTAAIGEKYLWIDDYFITGHLAYKINATFTHISVVNKQEFLDRKGLVWWENSVGLREITEVWRDLRILYAMDRMVSLISHGLSVYEGVNKTDMLVALRRYL